MGTVYNARLVQFEDDAPVVYIGRKHPRFPEGSVLANPFPITDSRDREQSIQLFRIHLWNQIKSQDRDVIKALLEIAENELSVLCWCAPLPCHGDIVLKAAHWLLNRDSETF